MHRSLLLFVLFLFVVGCKKSDAPDADSNAPALESGSVEEGALTTEGEDAAASMEDAPTDPDADPDDDSSVAEEDEAAKDEAEAPTDGIAKRQFRGKHEITLVSNGEAPRRLLRYNFEAMKPNTMEARTEVDTEIEGQPLVVPRVVQGLTVEKIEQRGDVIRVTVQSNKAKYEARVQNDPMHDMIIESMQQMADVGAIRFSFEMDRFGNTGNAEILSSDWATEDVEAMIAQQIDQFTNGFPSEPVGKGAKWTTKTELDMGGEFKVKATVHYQVKSIDEMGATIALRHEVADLTHAMDLEGVEDALMSGKLHGDGTMTVRFDRVMPVLHQTVYLDMKVQDQSKEVGMKLKVEMRVLALD